MLKLAEDFEILRMAVEPEALELVEAFQWRQGEALPGLAEREPSQIRSEEPKARDVLEVVTIDVDVFDSRKVL
jgi:hypothetical protein